MAIINVPVSGSNEGLALDIEKNLIIVGANGSGKSRFGSRLEQQHANSKRISAQRQLQINDTVQRQDYETASSALRNNFRNQTPTQPHADYQQVLISLFAQEGKRDSEYVAIMKESEEKIEIPKSSKEKVIDVWNFIFPYRPLRLENDRVQAVNSGTYFGASEMSDGEKVALYLISQVLLADEYCTLIIDEPELHLHKALMVRLWNRLEEIRKDCIFIYITHDLDFAVSKSASKIIWIKNYNAGVWDWELIESNDVIPENLYLEVLGSRIPILFIEGNKGSLDMQIYQSVYPNFTIIPCSSCEKVIESVKGLRAHSTLHDKTIYGIIDKDFRPESQLTTLESDGIYHINLNEIENIFLVPEITGLISSHLGTPEKQTIIENKIKDIYNNQKEEITFKASKFLIYKVINESLGTLSNLAEYETWKGSIVGNTDNAIGTIRAPDGNSLIEILEFYPHKGLVKQIQSILSFTGNGYQNLVLSLFSTSHHNEIVRIFKLYLPDIV